jgi:putative oxidoreductase
MTPGIAARLAATNQFLARVLGALQPALLAGTRLWVAWVFLKSGWLKLTSWDVTLELFRSEYDVPVLPPTLAAIAGTFGELFFPVLLVLGLCGRVGALGLFAVNALAVISYRHVLYSEGFEAAIKDHYLWGYLLLVLVVLGPGRWSVDQWLDRRASR